MLVSWSSFEKEVVNLIFCPNCGASLREEQRFCSNCGNDNRNLLLKGEGSESSSDNSQPTIGALLQPPNTTPPVNVKKSSLASKIIAIALIVLITGGGYYIYNQFFNDKPVAIVKKLFDAINNKDINGLVECLDPKTEKMYNVANNVAGALLGKVIGININPKDILDFLPSIWPELAQQEANKSGNDSDRVDTKYYFKGVASRQNVEDKLELIIRVDVETIYRNGQKETISQKIPVYLRKYPNIGWRIVLDNK